jgi:hypothetical protein
MDNLSMDLAVNTVLNIAKSEEIKDRSIDAMKSLGIMGLARRAEEVLKGVKGIESIENQIQIKGPLLGQI